MRTVLVLLAVAALAPAQKYQGPRPPKPDIPYLLHADRLVETEVSDAKEEKRKDDTTYTVAGTASPARTPLAEPVFLLEAKKLNPERLELYKFEVKNGRREVLFRARKRDNPRGHRLMVTPLGEGLFRIEVSENVGLENGQYSLTPAESNQVFCFEVY